MKRVGVLGGSFDPVHIGHVRIVKEAMQQLHLDQCILIPTKNNPWKNAHFASTTDRLEMLSIAFRDIPNITISKLEVETSSNTKNYTIDTISTLQTQWPSTSLYYIMGMDQACQFQDWMGAQAISERVQLIAFPRMGYKPNATLEKYHFQSLQMEPSGYASSLIRQGDIDGLDPNVLQYITNHGLYLETLLANTMSQKRFKHTKSMAHLAKEIANSNDIDANKAYIAGMFHDIAKEMPMDQAKSIMEQNFPQYLNKPVPVWHQWLSAFVAKNKYQINDPEILQAIENHTTASTTMSLLDMCIYVADKYDPDRGYDSSKEIALCKENVQQGFKKCLQDFVEYATTKQIPIDPAFDLVYEKYVKENINE